VQTERAGAVQTVSIGTCWLVERKINPHMPLFDKSGCSESTWSRADFEWDAENDQYICPVGQELKQFRRHYSGPNRWSTG